MTRISSMVIRQCLYIGAGICFESYNAAPRVAFLTVTVALCLFLLGMVYLKGCFEVLPFMAGAVAGAACQHFLFCLSRLGRGVCIGLGIFSKTFVSERLGWWFYLIAIVFWLFVVYPKIIYYFYVKAKGVKKEIKNDPEIKAKTKTDYINRWMTAIFKITLLIVGRLAFSTLSFYAMGYIGFAIPKPPHPTVPCTRLWIIMA